MATIFLSKEPCHMDSFEYMFGFPSKHVIDIKGCKPKMISPYRPYLVCEDRPTPADRSILIMLNNSSITPHVTEMGITFGPENSLGISEVALKAGDYTLRSTGLFGEHVHHQGEQMEEAAKKYKESLLKYREAVKNKAPRHSLKEVAIRDNVEFNRKFLDAVSSTNKTRAAILKNNPLRNFKRGLDMARTGRRFVLYDFESVLRASWLAKAAKLGKFLGPGVVALDFGIRSADVGYTAAEGGYWEREMFTEYLSFAGGTAIGSLTAGLLGLGVAAFLVATPAGWVMLLIGVGIGLVAGATGFLTDEYLKEKSGHWYDEIMKNTYK